MFNGKNAVVTGGSSGIGEAIGKKLAEEGARVNVLDLQQPQYNACFFETDIRDERSIAHAAQNVGGVDILVNNAGIYFENYVHDTSKEDLDRIVDINLKGPYLVSKHFIPGLKERKGCIINIASCLGIAPEPTSAAYCMTKAGVIMLTNCMAHAYADDGIRVNAVLPGPTDTPLLSDAHTAESARVSQMQNPLRRWARPEEIADAVAYLASDKAGFITGAQLAVDGGTSCSSLYTK